MNNHIEIPASCFNLIHVEVAGWQVQGSVNDWNGAGITCFYRRIGWMSSITSRAALAPVEDWGQR